MFTIIGADQKEYGPVSAEDISQWIAEGRADGQTYARADTDGEWKPLAAFPEFAAALAGSPAARLASGTSAANAPAAPSLEEIIARTNELDIMSCFSRSWELLKQNFWPVVGITFLVTALMIIIDSGLDLISNPSMQAMMDRLKSGHGFSTQGLGLILLVAFLKIPVQSVLMGGLYVYYLKLIRGEDPEVGDAFAGIGRFFVPLVVLGFVMTLLIFVGCCLCLIPGIYVSVAWMFAIPLVVDRNMNFWDAMELSRKVVTRQWFMVFALIILVAIVSLIGICALCVGILVTMPIAYIAMLYAYEDLFGRRTN